MFYNQIYSELNRSVSPNLLSSHVTKHIAAKTLSIKSIDLLIFIFNTVFFTSNALCQRSTWSTMPLSKKAAGVYLSTFGLSA